MACCHDIVIGFPSLVAAPYLHFVEFGLIGVRLNQAIVSSAYDAVIVTPPLALRLVDR